MAKEINNPLDVNLVELMRESTGQKPATDKAMNKSMNNKKRGDDTAYRHCSFICDPELWDKAQAIARRENFSVRQIMEHWMKAGIDSYEAKNGKIRLKAGRSLDDAL